MQDADDGGTAICRLFAGLCSGDLDAAIECLTEDGRVWHSFDRIAHDRDSIRKDWAQFVAGFPERSVRDVRRQATATGFVQQHVMVVRNAAGRQMAWPVCVVTIMEGDRIARLDEYIDRAGHYAPANEPAA